MLNTIISSPIWASPWAIPCSNHFGDSRPYSSSHGRKGSGAGDGTYLFAMHSFCDGYGHGEVMLHVYGFIDGDGMSERHH